MPEDLKLSQNGSSQLPPPFRGLHSPGVKNKQNKKLSNYLCLLFPEIVYLRLAAETPESIELGPVDLPAPWAPWPLGQPGSYRVEKGARLYFSSGLELQSTGSEWGRPHCVHGCSEIRICMQIQVHWRKKETPSVAAGPLTAEGKVGHDCRYVTVLILWR